MSISNNYTLNGYMFALLGLYGWSEIQRTRYENINPASLYFQRGIRALEKLLPYYDIEGFTAYDFCHCAIEKPPHILERYHAVRLYLLHALNSIAPSRGIGEATRRVD